MLIAPTEPRAIKALGRVSSLPEKMGADVLFAARGRKYGVQRKEIGDLINSVHDGRLQREMAQMTNRLDHAVLVVEGQVRWTLDGVLMAGNGAGRGGSVRQWTKAQHRALLYSVRAEGVWVETSSSVDDTVAAVVALYNWAAKAKHVGLRRRPGPIGTWGRPDCKEWAEHLLQGFEGVGPEMAGRIVDHFGGAPIAWSCTLEELCQIRGIGKVRAAQIMRGLTHP